MWPFKKQEVEKEYTQEERKLAEFTVVTYDGNIETIMAYRYTCSDVWTSFVTGDSEWVSYKTADIKILSVRQSRPDNVVPIRPEAVQ